MGARMTTRPDRSACINNYMNLLLRKLPSLVGSIAESAVAAAENSGSLIHHAARERALMSRSRNRQETPLCPTTPIRLYDAQSCMRIVSASRLHVTLSSQESELILMRSVCKHI